MRALRTSPRRNRRGEKIGVGKAACRLHLDGDGKRAISKQSKDENKVGWIDIDKRGDVYDEDCDIDGDVFYERGAKRLIPDIYCLHSSPFFIV